MSEIVPMKWHSSNYKRYMSFGYTYTNIGDEFEVSVKHLSPTSKVRITAQCDYCGSIYTPEYGWYMNGRKKIPKDACVHCKSKKQHELDYMERAKIQYQKLLDSCNKLGYKLVTRQEDYRNNEMNIEYICPSHGLMRSPYGSLLKGKGCWLCGIEKLHNSTRNTSQFVKEYVERFNNNILINSEEYVNTTTDNLQIRCNCGRIYKTSFARYHNSEVKKCPHCTHTISIGESLIEQYFVKNSINYIRQYKFSDCRDQKVLPFDFYLPDYGLCVEYDGEQHFYNVFGYDSFVMTQRHDKIKNEYCLEKGIELLRIPYYERSHIHEILQNKIGEVGKRNSLIS